MIVKRKPLLITPWRNFRQSMLRRDKKIVVRGFSPSSPAHWVASVRGGVGDTFDTRADAAQEIWIDEIKRGIVRGVIE